MDLKSKDINITALAYLGDAVYEVYVREHVMESGNPHADALHQQAIKYVSAAGQAKIVKKLMTDFLTEEEVKFVKKARNHKYTSKAKNADPVTYKLATAFEALIGKCYVDKDQDRLNQIIEYSIGIIEESEAKHE